MFRKSIATITMLVVLGIAACGTEDTNTDDSTTETMTSATDGTTSNPSTGSTSTGGDTTTTSGVSDGASSTGEQSTTVTTDVNTTGDPTTGECPVAQPDCPCGVNDYCDGDNTCQKDGTCGCDLTGHGCDCSVQGGCAVEGDVCYEPSWTCLGCEAVENPYCTGNCGPPDTVQVKEFPSDAGFPWAMCAVACPMQDGQPAPEKCPKPEGFEGTMECMVGTPWGDICYASCTTDKDCPHANHCLDWGDVLWCMGDNPYEMAMMPMTLPTNSDLATPMFKMNETDQFAITQSEACTLATCSNKVE